MSPERVGEAVQRPAIRRTEPTKSLLQGGAYTHSSATDLKARFERMAAEALDFSGPSLRELKQRRAK